MLSAKELAAIRADVESDLLPDTCAIKTRSENQDDSGWLGEPTPSTRVTVACRLDAISQQTSSQALVAHLESGKVLYQLSVPYDTDIRDSDFVTINSEDYEVMYVHREQTDRFVRRAVLSKVYDGASD